MSFKQLQVSSELTEGKNPVLTPTFRAFSAETRAIRMWIPAQILIVSFSISGPDIFC